MRPAAHSLVLTVEERRLLAGVLETGLASSAADSCTDWLDAICHGVQRLLKADTVLAYLERRGEHDDDERSGAFGLRGFAIMQLCAPAFRAAARMERLLAGQRRSLEAHLERMTSPAALLDRTGRTHYANPALARLQAALHGADRELLWHRLQVWGRRVVAGQPHELRGLPASSLRVAGVSFRVSASRMELGASEPLALVALLSEAPSIPTPSEIRVTYGLTLREAEFARWILEGRSTATMAVLAHVSRNTARRHIEAVLRKTGARTRTELILRMLGSAASEGHPPTSDV